MRVRALTLVAIAALVFQACSSTPAASPVPASGGSAAPSSAPTTAPTSAPSAAAGGGQLNFTRLSDFPTCFHPICFQTGNQFLAFQLLYTGLLKRDQTEKVIGSLADTWDVSADATTYTFHLVSRQAPWNTFVESSRLYSAAITRFMFLTILDRRLPSLSNCSAQ